MAEPSAPQVLHTTAGDFPLHESRLRLGGREWRLLHTGVVLTFDDEQAFLRELRDRLPYGVALWPAAIALAHDVAARADELRGARVLELGAGTGLPGIVAASLGARVVQTDRHQVPMTVCRRNGELNGAAGIEYRTADWSAWDDTGRYDLILGSDLLKLGCQEEVGSYCSPVGCCSTGTYEDDPVTIAPRSGRWSTRRRPQASQPAGLSA